MSTGVQNYASGSGWSTNVCYIEARIVEVKYYRPDQKVLVEMKGLRLI
jgi:hypothetical protein